MTSQNKSSQPPTGTAHTIAPQVFIVRRGNQLQLRLRGTKIGFGKYTDEWNEQVDEVTIYRTTGGVFVSQEYRYKYGDSSWRGESSDDAGDIVQFLADENGRFGAAAEAALAQAARNDAAFAEAFSVDLE